MRTYLSLFATAALFAWTLSPAFADDPANPQTQQSSDQAHHESHGHSGQHAGFDVGPHSAPLLRASTLMGSEVWNANNEKLGSINDLVVNLKMGKIDYAVLEHGGTLGVGDRLYPIPASALSIRFDNQKNKHYFALNVDKNHFQTAPSFTKNEWPDFTKQDFVSRVDQFYRDIRTATRPGTEQGTR